MDQQVHLHTLYLRDLVGALDRLFRFGEPALASLDLYNALNSSAVLALSNAFATWQRPEAILPARFAKVVLQFDF